MAILVCACVQARAAEDGAPDPYRYGIRVLSAAPRQDFRQVVDRAGRGAGLFVETGVGSGWIAQTRFDYLAYPQVDDPGTAAIASYVTPSAGSLTVNSAALGVDLRHPLPVSGWLGRFYGLVGATAIRYEYLSAATVTQADANGNPVTGVERQKNKTPFKLGVAVGAGVEIARGLCLAGRFTSVNIDGVTLGTFETSLSYRF